MQFNWKKTAALALLAAVCAVPAYAEERPKLADGELFVNERIVKDGRVLYKALDIHDSWEHDPEKQVPGLVVTAFIPPKDGKVGPELASVKKLTTKQEKILAARRHYTGAEHVVTLPTKVLPRYGNLRVRFSDSTGHALDDMDVAMER